VRYALGMGVHHLPLNGRLGIMWWGWCSQPTDRSEAPGIMCQNTTTPRGAITPNQRTAAECSEGRKTVVEAAMSENWVTGRLRAGGMGLEGADGNFGTARVGLKCHVIVCTQART
jgi:hypothetical protein